MLSPFEKKNEGKSVIPLKGDLSFRSFSWQVFSCCLKESQPWLLYYLNDGVKIQKYPFIPVLEKNFCLVPHYT